MVRAGEGEAKLPGGIMQWVKARPGKDGRIRVARAEKVKGGFGVGKKTVPEVVGEVGVDG